MNATTYAGKATETCDLCIVGAGIAGLNALFVAAQYLPATARIILIDKNPSCGGMWIQSYDYVRLHQPHQMFTVGDFDWQWDRPPEYLATGKEVLWHLQTCLARLRDKVELSERYRTTCLSIGEADTPTGPKALVQCVGPDGCTQTIEASRAIHAAGWDIPTLAPLSLSSGNVISTSPFTLSQDDLTSSAPALVVGGGKTGMDTALALIDGNEHREVTMVNGKGAVFGNRDILFPVGAARRWQGVMVGNLSADVVRRFDGTNAEAAFDYFRRTYAISPDMDGQQYMFSTMSEAESQRLEQGLSAIRHGYVDDVIDGSKGPYAALRDGSRMALAPGTLVVNCTSHFNAQPRDPAPVVSPKGTTLNVSPRASVYFLSTSAAYFLTHAFYRNVLCKMPLYVLDMESLKSKDPQFYFLTCLTHSFLNMMTIMDHVPLSVFSRCGLDINRWFPLHRRLLSFARLKMKKRSYMSHCRAILDELHQTGEIACKKIPC